mmetsp:Transcript_1909/g.4752  ORF Transcript_1909/g.4752 Transcript_1909/m.4752 type:complete len:591 (+) Transcript_1909:64-1836(+)
MDAGSEHAPPEADEQEGIAQFAGNEMLASFLWAVGEDAMAQSPPPRTGPEGLSAGAAGFAPPILSAGGAAHEASKCGGNVVAQETKDEGAGDHAGSVQHEDSGVAMAALVAAQRQQQHLQAQQQQVQQQVEQAQQAQAQQQQQQQNRAMLGGHTLGVSAGFADAGSGSATNIGALPPRHDATGSVPTAAFNMPFMPQPRAFDPSTFSPNLFANPLTNPLLAGVGAPFPGAGGHPGLLPMGLGGACAFPRLVPPVGMGTMPSLHQGLPPPAGGDQAKNQQRLQRKAESARVARVRKKHYVATLELEVSELRAKVHALQRAQNPGATSAQLPAAGEREAQENMDVKVQEMTAILQRQSIDRLTSDVNNLVEQFVQNQRQRQNSINFHFDEILDLLDTGPQYKMAFWDALQGRMPAGEAGAGAAPGDSMETGEAQHSVRTGSELLDMLVNELQMTPAQAEKLENCRLRCEEMQTSLMHCHQLVQQAREQVLYNISAAQQVMDNMRGVLTPQQVCSASRGKDRPPLPVLCARCGFVSMVTFHGHFLACVIRSHAPRVSPACPSQPIRPGTRAGGSLPGVGREEQAQHGSVQLHH